ncbi:ADP-heptose:LPS heptosyltransferase [Arthrobacter sp. V4I6]|uniref:glycosyltransferase family 9 protein n=1 Tax=unclassified Arthrobacter TaxID=235627 RepID=UPI00277EA4E6|nr:MULTISPECIES: glycosyltransferase family 9 protein [unclassified Arthrobacter]MDQ0819597.1 ADP-heptose:LPS heptosyltransferase [Arthrobacter sp. V1I7]MDQ0853777.1 ADP-heptose:LPS heptosyltransferase [Arthrobacter sp. V4I6]
MDETTAEFGGAEVVGWGVGPVLEKLPDVAKIAVLRGGGLGDLMFALPAVAALGAAYPDAALTLLGTPLHRELLLSTHAPVRDVRILPFAEGVRPGPEDAVEVERFFADMVSEKFDLAIQLHGGGRFSNPFLLRLGARHSAGLRTADAADLDRSVPYVYYQHEPLRALEVVGLVGAPPIELEARLRPLAEFVDQADLLLGELASPLVAIHPGATDPRRRWPAGLFGEVAAACASDGCRVVVVGASDDKDLASQVVDAACSRQVTSLAGELDLGTLAALLGRCSVLLGNDSGPRHLAQAMGTPTVGLYWVGNVINAGPLGRSLHRAHLSWVTHCPDCGSDVTQVGYTSVRCPHDESLLASIRPEDVLADVRLFTATGN